MKRGFARKPDSKGKTTSMKTVSMMGGKLPTGKAPKVKAQTVSMTGKGPAANEPWMKKAKKSEPDNKPIIKPGPPSVNKNIVKNRVEKRLAGVKI